MKVLLDEDVPRYLMRELTQHHVSTVPESGWSGIGNGVLLDLAAAADFEVLLTCDRNLQNQQNVPVLKVAIVVLAVGKRRRQTILPLAPEIRDTLAGEPQPGTLTIVGRWREEKQTHHLIN